jgi:hypothetical protein
MKQNRVSQKERERILQMYGSKYLNEETTSNKTIQDIQNLLGLTGNQADNILGPQTLKLIQTKLGQPDKTPLPKVDGFTYQQYKDAEYTDEVMKKDPKFAAFYPSEKGVNITTTTTTQSPETIKMGTMKVKSITTAPTKDGVQVGVERTGGETSKVTGTDDKQVIDSANP